MAYGALHYGVVQGELQIKDDSATLRSLMGPAWCVLDPQTLYARGASRYANLPISGADGSLPRGYLLDERVVTLDMGFSGWVSYANVAHANHWLGMEANVAQFETWFLVPPSGGYRDSSLIMPSGTTRTAKVQPVHLEMGKQIDGKARATLTIVLPGGRFA